MRVHGPDGRVWTVVRRTDPPRAFSLLLPGQRWTVLATTGDEVRRWEAPSRRAANALLGEVALALRTGAESPAGELLADDEPEARLPGGSPPEQPEPSRTPQEPDDPTSRRPTSNGVDRDEAT